MSKNKQVEVNFERSKRTPLFSGLPSGCANVCDAMQEAQNNHTSEYDIVGNQPENMMISKLKRVFCELSKRIIDKEMDKSNNQLLCARRNTNIHCITTPTFWMNKANIETVAQYNRAIYVLREYLHQLSV